MCDKTILENDGTLEAVTYCYKNQEMYNKAIGITLMHYSLFLLAI